MSYKISRKGGGYLSETSLSMVDQMVVSVSIIVCRGSWGVVGSIVAAYRYRVKQFKKS